ncbi:MAG: hypothetical protein ACFB13_10685 [Kiloniellaceae bacterium]
MLAAHWFKQPLKADAIKVGSVYKLAHEGNIVEIAKVVDVGPDALGIPHVTYDVSVERARLAKYEERRTLGLQSFAERFRDAVAPEKAPQPAKHDA